MKKAEKSGWGFPASVHCPEPPPMLSCHLSSPARARKGSSYPAYIQIRYTSNRNEWRGILRAPVRIALKNGARRGSRTRKPFGAGT